MNLADTAVVLDTCVLLKPRMSDVIMDIRAENVMSVHWTLGIDAEFLKNATAVFGLSATAAERRLSAMKRRCPDWELFASTLDASMVPGRVDEKDRHVAAAALTLRRSADEDGDAFDVLLVTDNVKDFAPGRMGALGVRVMTSGQFLDEAFAARPDAVERALDRAVRDLRAPPYSLEELLFALQEQGARSLTRAIADKRRVVPRKKDRRPPSD
ncbi:hypothetical protein [Xylophilus sp. GOD-11R]|uniref:hypothetical protein n=1 Tax=Xylophilus sp. GOD-11R TaxID=3089814 RepID=UPI00298C5854|nr:hypothetical protein [Xylophilus sp. GOD-11R]WPB55458.1 hypothetical protein R9X41_15060 [Xylophilus sp. GOD-11R]